MKQWLLVTAALAAAGALSRLPHPAVDVAELIPVRVVYMAAENGYTIITDGGLTGTGTSPEEAAQALKSNAPGELLMDTAEYLILPPGTAVTQELYGLLRPDCRVVYMEEPPDLETAAELPQVRESALTLAKLRAEGEGKEPYAK